MEKYGQKWKQIEKSVKIQNYIKKKIQQKEKVWKHIEIYRNIWKYIEQCGSIKKTSQTNIAFLRPHPGPSYIKRYIYNFLHI